MFERCERALHVSTPYEFLVIPLNIFLAQSVVKMKRRWSHLDLSGWPVVFPRAKNLFRTLVEKAFRRKFALWNYFLRQHKDLLSVSNDMESDSE